MCVASCGLFPTFLRTPRPFSAILPLVYSLHLRGKWESTISSHAPNADLSAGQAVIPSHCSYGICLYRAEGSSVSFGQGLQIFWMFSSALSRQTPNIYSSMARVHLAARCKAAGSHFPLHVLTSKRPSEKGFVKSHVTTLPSAPVPYTLPNFRKSYLGKRDWIRGNE